MRVCQQTVKRLIFVYSNFQNKIFFTFWIITTDMFKCILFLFLDSTVGLYGYEDSLKIFKKKNTCILL